MVLGFSIAAVGALLFFPASILHMYALFLAALFIVAIGIVILQVAANPYVTILGPAKTASSRLTMVQGVGSIGTTVAPIIGSYFILSQLGSSEGSSEAVRFPYLVIAGMLIAIAFTVSRLKLPTVITVGSQQINQDNKQVKGVFSFRNLNFGAIAIFVYVGAEVSIGTFLTNYISDTMHIDVKDSNTFVAFYWGGMMVGRLIGSFVLKSIKPSLVLAVCAAMSILLIVISVTSNGQLAIWSMILIGVFNSVMFAIIFSLSVNGLGEHTTKASGILSTAIVGGAIISYAQGLLIDSFTWPVAFMLPLVCYAYILFYGVNGYRSSHNIVS
jgi:FHS family L-fucose permease-like MFS transporter